MGLEGRVAVVTGGARGIGLAITRALADRGASVHVFDVAPGEGSEPLPYRFHKVDICDSAAVAAAVAQLPAAASLLVNNAGITRDRTLVNMTDDEWRSVLSVNLTGAFHMARALAPGMRKAGYGRIVNITSINGMRGKFGQANYSASKAESVLPELATPEDVANVVLFLLSDAARMVTGEVIRVDAGQYI